MANSLFEKGREGFLDGTCDWDTNTFKIALLDTGTADTGIKAITSASNATPIAVSCTSHGFTTGDIVFIDGVSGNLAANGVWKITVSDANTFTLQRPDGTNAVGSGAGTGGYVVNLGPSASGDNWDDFDGALVGTAQTLTGPTVTAGVAGANNPTFTSVTGNSVEALAIYKDTGSAATSRMVALLTGKHIVTVAADAAISATTIWVEPLAAGIASGQVLTFSNGQSATLSGTASQGARSISVNALAAAITAGNRALATANGSGLPVTPNGGNIAVTFDPTYKIFKL